MTSVVGVDGCRLGWIAAEVDGRDVSTQLFATFVELLDAVGNRPLGVDMPLGPLPASMAGADRRRSELAAREFLGPARSSIFWSPSADVLERWRRDPVHPVGIGVSVQTWNLLPKIAEVADALAARPREVFEVHPECSFRAMAPDVVFVSKKTPVGRQQRLGALRRWGDVPLPVGPAARFVEDALDAAAVAWSVARWTRGEALTLPDDPAPGEPVVTV